ncbi:MAG: nitrite reductase small subunit NirD [Alphaproteobacteria bacterium]|nr:nitrite reductase small subunit NirD [Alphaproteobacteria bacterium]MBU1279796.1 nitrite reductase small subunit NirD [Alphaproteobacteria bacterium]MBU1574732.1 nitrite reductase small subunit NirD [Alphaproteobacteria bacterium]MBU1827913.1 nitrite reductase small subunit NirD [Alphaproteobacteria bacterium]MBU2079312.1 nitrite reductase small subunit NirD [Alphaproteobacteria bacterium]
MNVQAKTWVSIGPLTEIPRQGARCVKNGDVSIAVFRTSQDQVFALEDKCPHKNGPLSQGIVHEGCVTCPLHNWVISLETGAAQGADVGQTATFEIKIEDGIVLLAL